MKTLAQFLEARMIATGDFKVSASGRKVRRLIKVGDDDYHKADDIDKDGDVDADDAKAKKMRGESVEHIEEATVKSAKYSWGTMKTVHHGKDFSIPLHPEHHKPIAALKHGESHSFKDETGNKWKATREDDTVHFHGGSYGTQKTSVKHDTMKESVELEEAADKQDSRLMQLARLGLLDKNDVAIFRNAMQTFKADKQLSIKQRNMLLSVYNDLVNMVTGDDAMFARAKLDVQKEDTDLEEGKRGLWDNIHAKRKRIASGSGEKMRKPGSEGAPTAQDFKDAQESVEESKVYDPFTKKMVATKPIKVQAGGGATRNGVPVETGPSKYKTISQAYHAATAGQTITPKQKLKNEETEHIDEISKGLVARYANKVAKTTQSNYDKSKDKFQFSSNRQDGMKNAVKRLTKEETQSEGYYKDIDTNAKEDERLGSWKKETPWRKIKPGSDTVTDKSGATHTPMSKVRHLARLALKKTTSK